MWFLDETPRLINMIKMIIPIMTGLLESIWGDYCLHQNCSNLFNQGAECSNWHFTNATIRLLSAGKSFTAQMCTYIYTHTLLTVNID